MLRQLHARPGKQAVADELPAWSLQDDYAGGWLADGGMVVPMLLDGLVNSAWFDAYVAKVLAPELRPGECANYFRTCGYEPKWTETALKNFTQHS